MGILKINSVFNQVQFCLLVPTILILSVQACLWNVFLWNRIKKFNKKYLKAIRESRNDPFGNYIHLAVEYKKEYGKYCLLLVINIVEMLGALGYAFGSTFIYFLWESDRNIEFPNRFANKNCTVEISRQSGMSDMAINTLTEVSIGGISITIGQVSIMWSMALVVCLIQYLSDEYNNIINTAFMKKTGLISLFIIITECIKELRLIQILLEPIIQIIYFIIWVKHIRFFYEILHKRINAYKVQQRDKSVIERATANKNQFGIIMFLNVTAYACFLLGELMTSIFFIAFTGVYYGPCLFSYLYGFPAYEPLIRDPEQVETLILANAIVGLLIKVLITFAQTIMTTHYTVLSGALFWMNYSADLKTRFGFGVRTRFTPSQTNPLRFTHQK